MSSSSNASNTPTKPPRAVSTSPSSSDVNKGSGKSAARSPALWQIFFDEKEPDKPLTAPDEERVGKYVRMVDPTEDEFNTHELLSGQRGGASAATAVGVDSGDAGEDALQLYPPSGSRGVSYKPGKSSQKQNAEVDIVIADKKRTSFGEDEFGNTSRPFAEQQWESVDMMRSGAQHGDGNKRLLRTDSDLELAFPGSHRDSYGTRCGYFCGNCQQYPWKANYLVVIAVGASVVLAYVLVVLIVWQAFL